MLFFPRFQSRHREDHLSRVAYPRFGPRVEELEAREVPTVTPFTVDTTDDTAFAKLNKGVPVDANGHTSLRAVIEYGNDNPKTGDPSKNNYQVDLSGLGGQKITIDANNNAVTTLELLSNFNFFNGDAATMTVERSTDDGAFRLFDLGDGDEVSVSVSFYNMNLQYGAGGDGGAIRVRANSNLKVTNCGLYNNTASNGGGDLGYGGAIYAGSGTTVWITDSTLSGNNAQTGGVDLTIHGGTISGNGAIGTGKGEGNGGGLFIENTFSTVIDNGATLKGGGVYLVNSTTPDAVPVF